MLERVWPAGLAKAKDQEGQTTGVGHPRGMWLQWRIVHKTLSHEMFSFVDVHFMLTINLLVNSLLVNIAYMNIWVQHQCNQCKKLV